MLDTSNPKNWPNAADFKPELIERGWKSPDTYGGHFSSIEDISAVYLFLLHETEIFWFKKCLVAYVGMTTQLQQRLYGHPTLAEIRKIECPDRERKFWAQRWFKPTPKSELRDLERHYIQRYDPPWNLIGRQKGIVVQ